MLCGEWARGCRELVRPTRLIRWKRLCLSVLSSLDDTVFPLMHRVILQAISSKWPDLALDPADNVFMQGGESRGVYAQLPLGVARPKSKEDVMGCAKRVGISDSGLRN